MLAQLRQERLLLQEKLRALEEHKQLLEGDVAVLQDRVVAAEASARDASAAASQLPNLRAAVASLRGDNARLVTLLASTKEYKAFVA